MLNTSTLIIFCALLTFSISSLLILITFETHPKPPFYSHLIPTNKKIIAFSLRKKIEFVANQSYKCPLKKISAKQKTSDMRWVETVKGVFVFSAHWDGRLHPYNYVRSIVMVKGKLSGNSLFCHVAATNGEIYVTKAEPTEIWAKNWDLGDENVYYHPYLLSCLIPENFQAISVSFSDIQCDLKNSVKINKQKSGGKRNFTVCVKPLNYKNDISKHLLQWIALNQVFMGENGGKFEFYSSENFNNFFLELLNKSSVINLNKFEKLELKSGDLLNTVWQKRRYELIAYNDCFYRNVYTSNYIVPLDIDEIIAPRNANSWAEMLQDILNNNNNNNNVENRDFASYTVSNTYFLRQFNLNRYNKRINDDIFFFRDIIRTEFSPNGESGKSFISTEKTLTVFNHYTLHVLRPGIRRNLFLSTDFVQMNHYKSECQINILPQCAKYIFSPIRVLDNVVFQYKKAFYEKYNKLIKFLS